MGSPDGIRWEMGRDVGTCRFHVPRFSLLLAAVFLLSLVALQQQTAFAQAVNGTDWKTLLRIRNELNFTNPARSPKAYWKSAKSCDELFGVICDDLGYVVALSFLPPATLLSPHPIHPGRFPCSTLYGFNGSLPFPLFTSMSSPPPPCCPPIPFTPVVSPAARCMGSTALSPTPLANCPPSPSSQHYSLHSYVLVLKRASVCPETFVSSLSFSLLLSLLPSPPLLPLPSFPPLSPSSHARSAGNNVTSIPSTLSLLNATLTSLNMAQNRLTGSLPVGISRLS
ncbi:unnamed protein product [Closterium sp. NIES-64]|nr:unnamed protein product [Closterium sp. NIES-64]